MCGGSPQRVGVGDLVEVVGDAKVALSVVIDVGLYLIRKADFFDSRSARDIGEDGDRIDAPFFAAIGEFAFVLGAIEVTLGASVFALDLDFDSHLFVVLVVLDGKVDVAVDLADGCGALGIFPKAVIKGLHVAFGRSGGCVCGGRVRVGGTWSGTLKAVWIAGGGRAWGGGDGSGVGEVRCVGRGGEGTMGVGAC